MAGITALGTTYNLPNYAGILHLLSPSDTPLFSAIGGLTGGGQTTSTEFEWQTSDLRDADQNVSLEGATAPSEQNRVRANVTNVTQIHQETVGVSYSKLGAHGQKAGANNVDPNPITDELDWQTKQMLLQMVNDVEFSFINGVYQKPSDNLSPRKTRGIRSAATNVVNLGAAVGTASAAESTGNLTLNSHGLTDGDQIYLRSITAGGISDRVVYFVTDATTNTFKLSLTDGGAAIPVSADGNADVFELGSDALTPDTVGEFLQAIYDSGGIRESGAAALLVGSSAKRAISKAYADAYGKSDALAGTRNVGGVNVTTIETDFGVLNVMLSRHMPRHEVAAVSLEQCRPVYLEVPGKGHFFAEPLAKTGAKETVQLYGEVGLAYGSPNAHGVLTGLAV